MHPFLATLALLPLLAAAAPAQQGTVFADDFEDGILDPAWEVVFSLPPTMTVFEGGGRLQCTDAYVLQGSEASHQLTHDLPALDGSIRLEVPLEWRDHPLVPPGASHAHVAFELLDAHDQPLASAVYEDVNDAGGGEWRMEGATPAVIGSLPAVGDGTLTLGRDATGTVRYAFRGSAGAWAGTLGRVAGTVVSVRIRFRHRVNGIFSQPFFGPVALEEVVVEDVFEPLLTATGFAVGQRATLRLEDATPGGTVLFLTSAQGGGPTQTPIGVLELTPPIRALPPVTADSAGVATWSTVPAPLYRGWDLWFQAWDAQSGTPSNGVMVTVQ